MIRLPVKQKVIERLLAVGQYELQVHKAYLCFLLSTVFSRDVGNGSCLSVWASLADYVFGDSIADI